MTILQILHYPHPNLHIKASPITEIDANIKQIAQDMLDTLYASGNGIGLAATQVDRHIRLVVIDLSETRDQALILINPEIISKLGEAISEEGCLSLPSIYDKVSRYENIHLKYQNLAGEHLELKTDGLLSICIQHEIDHLDGKVFIERLSLLKKDRAIKKLKKHQKNTL